MTAGGRSRLTPGRRGRYKEAVSDALAPVERMLAERACERLVGEFARRLDLGTPAAVAELFTEDGVWEWPLGRRRVQGRADLARYFGSRPPDRLSRRLTTNVLVDVLDATRAAATSYLTTYRVDGWAGELGPPPPPTQVGHYVDVLRRVDGVWLLAHRTTHLAFGGETPRAPGRSDEEEVLAAARERAGAMAGEDEERLRRLLHPGFGWVSHTGESFDLESYLDSNRRGSNRWYGQELRDPTVRVVGDTAVLRCVVVDTVDVGRGPETFVMPMTQTWVRTVGGWRCLGGHAGPRT